MKLFFLLYISIISLTYSMEGHNYRLQYKRARYKTSEPVVYLFKAQACQCSQEQGKLCIHITVSPKFPLAIDNPFIESDLPVKLFTVNLAKFSTPIKLVKNSAKGRKDKIALELIDVLTPKYTKHQTLCSDYDMLAMTQDMENDGTAFRIVDSESDKKAVAIEDHLGRYLSIIPGHNDLIDKVEFIPLEDSPWKDASNWQIFENVDSKNIGSFLLANKLTGAYLMIVSDVI